MSDDSAWTKIGLDQKQIEEKIRNAMITEDAFLLSYLPDTHQVEMHIYRKDHSHDYIFKYKIETGEDTEFSEWKDFKDRAQCIIDAPDNACEIHVTIRIGYQVGNTLVVEPWSAKIDIPEKQNEQ